MQSQFVRTEPGHAGTRVRPRPSHIRAASSIRGFFTIGFAIATLIAGALGVGIVEAVTPESGLTQNAADGDRLLPADSAKVEDSNTVAASKAASQLAAGSSSAGKALR
jgi:hypothetical protein